MRHGRAGSLITSYPLPPNPPEAVLTAQRAFEAAADAYGEAIGRISDLEEEARLKLGEARKQHAAARVEGAAPPKRSARQVEEAYAAKVRDAKDDAEALAEAVHARGNEMADAVEAAKADWHDRLVAEEEQITARLEKALRDAKTALVALADARSAPSWLAEFDAGLAQWGVYGGFVSQAIRLDASVSGRTTHFDDTTEAVAYLALLESAVHPEPEQQPRVHTTVPARDSSMGRV